MMLLLLKFWGPVDSTPWESDPTHSQMTAAPAGIVSTAGFWDPL